KGRTGNPRGCALHPGGDLAHLVLRQLRGPEGNDVRLVPVRVRSLRRDEVASGDRHRRKALGRSAAGFRSDPVEMVHAATPARGQRGTEPLQVYLRPAKSAEVWETLPNPLPRDQADQGEVQAA